MSSEPLRRHTFILRGAAKELHKRLDRGAPAEELLALVLRAEDELVTIRERLEDQLED